MTTRERNLYLPLEQITDFCRRNPILKLSLFGSVLRDDFTNQSDIDFLVELDPAAKVGLFGFMGMQCDLEDMIGRKVDLRTIDNFPERLQSHVRNSAEVLYVR